MELHAAQTFCFFISLLCLRVAADQPDVSPNVLTAPEVHTTLGALRGLQLNVKGTDTRVHAYLGVPFAKPPIGPSRRLRAPQPIEGWEGVRDATKQPLICIQGKKRNLEILEKMSGMLMDIPDVSEDCLYLNIFTPANRDEDAKLPVMVWIHGGGFSFGFASMYDGSAMAAYQDVVVVVIQYRLGLLGFLSTGDEQMSGNFGLLDQIQALRWTKQHIHNFGGDPDLVTIFGESAGGVSVSLLLLSPLSDGLFQRAIAESGTAAIDLIMSDNPFPLTQAIANGTGCSIKSTEEIGDCMRNLDLDSIMAIAEDVQIRYTINVDGHFLKKSVDELFEKHELLTIPFMTGFNSDEGGWLMADFFGISNWTEGFDRNEFRKMLSMFFPGTGDDFKIDLLTEEYIGTGKDRVKNRKGFTEFLGDLVFNLPAIKTANAHRDAGADVYLYEYKYPPRFLKKNRPDFVGSDHGDEIFMVLGFCFLTKNVGLVDPCPEEEVEFSKTMMNYWGNFARTGSPNGEGLTHWPKYGGDEKYMGLDLKSESGHQLKKDRFVFMTHTLPEKIKEHQQKTEHVEL
ncbi:liver carboxylesterase 2-like isoform X2 [Gouania willdenowi]|uniref:liver carboxylesterase 2-like isoform X2 n=1 Tax=Gouania willdenowi TaxID=441366 RepID=UPI001054A02E|nr:liver carboxylesterase 2-like isoform X2 [Gouania willdenowi]